MAVTHHTLLEGPDALNQSAQQHACQLVTQLDAALNASSADTAAALSSVSRELKQVVGVNAKLAKALAAAAAPLQPPTDQQQPGTAAPPQAAAAADADAEELHSTCQQRQELLQELLLTLDASVQGLRAHLDACHKLLHTPPCKEDPETIIRYAHTLRHGFAPLGTAPGLPPIPPAPQLPFMLHSTLRLYHMDLAAQQQQQQQAPTAAAGTQPQALLPPPAQGGAQAQPLPVSSVGQQPEEAAAAGAAAAAAPVPPTAAAPAPIMQFRLNADMDDDEWDAGVTASESEETSDDYDESDTE